MSDLVYRSDESQVAAPEIRMLVPAVTSSVDECGARECTARAEELVHRV